MILLSVKITSIIKKRGRGFANNQSQFKLACTLKLLDKDHSFKVLFVRWVTL